MYIENRHEEVCKLIGIEYPKLRLGLENLRTGEKISALERLQYKDLDNEYMNNLYDNLMTNDEYNYITKLIKQNKRFIMYRNLKAIVSPGDYTNFKHLLRALVIMFGVSETVELITPFFDNVHKYNPKYTGMYVHDIVVYTYDEIYNIMGYHAIRNMMNHLWDTHDDDIEILRDLNVLSEEDLPSAIQHCMLKHRDVRCILDGIDFGKQLTDRVNEYYENMGEFPNATYLVKKYMKVILPS